MATEQPRPNQADVLVCGSCANRWGPDAWSNDCRHAVLLKKETERLERIVLDQQEVMQKLEKKNDQLTRTEAERGETNLNLNKEVARLIKLLKKNGINHVKQER